MKVEQIWWVGYVRLGQPATVLKPDGDRTYPAGRIYPTWGQICPTVPDGHGTGTRPDSDKSDTSHMSDLGSDISD
jgi:hypothetical protein